MARRRLAPAEPLPEGHVPRAEHPEPGFPRAAPIARVAAEAASTAALEELADTLKRARDEGRMVLDLPLDAVAADHLVRDRLPAAAAQGSGDDEEAGALRESIRAHGQRTPIEVTPLDGDPAYGLISGWRRLAALKALLAETGDPCFATIRALVHRPETAADAYVAMVEENEIRLGLSQYERARVAARATERGVFPTEKAALLALFATASRPKRSRIRSFLELYHALDGTLRFPTHLPERLGLALVEHVRAGGRDAVAAAITRDDPQTPEAELATLARLLRKPAAPRPKPPAAPVLPGVTLAESLRGRTLTLTLTGEGVTPELAAEVRAAIEALRR